MIRLKISYSARNRVRCWRRTYLGKFSSRISTGSPLALKIRSTSRPTLRSCSVRSGLESVSGVIGDSAAFALALDPRLFGAARRVIRRRRLQRPDQLVGLALARELLENSNRPVQVFGAEAVRRNDLHDRGVFGRPRALVRPEQLFVQPLTCPQPGVDDLDVRARA